MEPGNGVFNKVAKVFGGQENLASSTTLNLTKPEPVIYDDEYFEGNNTEGNNDKLRKLPKTSGFRLIQALNESTILVSGTDGYIYLTNNSENYDISSPWGGPDVAKNIFSYDVFGRLIWYSEYRVSEGAEMVEVGVAYADDMLYGAKAA